MNLFKKIVGLMLCLILTAGCTPNYEKSIDGLLKNYGEVHEVFFKHYGNARWAMTVRGNKYEIDPIKIPMVDQDKIIKKIKELKPTPEFKEDHYNLVVILEDLSDIYHRTYKAMEIGDKDEVNRLINEELIVYENMWENPLAPKIREGFKVLGK